MALSVLPIKVDKDYDPDDERKPGEIFGLYDSEKNAYVSTGNQKDMERLKHHIESGEQKLSFAQANARTKASDLEALMSTGMNAEQAHDTLRKLKPYLYS